MTFLQRTKILNLHSGLRHVPKSPTRQINRYYSQTIPRKMSTILVVGATGNIGVSAITAALRNKYKVLAIVRNQDSEEKLFKHVGTKEGITTTEADVLSETGVQGVVEKVKKGELPAFQHVYSCGTCAEGLIPYK